MAERNNEKKKGIDLVVSSAIQRILAGDQAETPSAPAPREKTAQEKAAPSKSKTAKGQSAEGQGPLEKAASGKTKAAKAQTTQEKAATAKSKAAKNQTTQEKAASGKSKAAKNQTTQEKAASSKSKAAKGQSAEGQGPLEKAASGKTKATKAQSAEGQGPLEKAATAKSKAAKSQTTQEKAASGKTKAAKAQPTQEKAASSKSKAAKAALVPVTRSIQAVEAVKPAKPGKPRTAALRKSVEDDSPLAIFSSNQLASRSQKRQAVSVITERRKTNRDHKVRVIPLGGLGEVGKNMTMIEYDEDVLVVDGGISFPGDGMFGIDLVLPDYSYLIEKKNQVRAFLLTHGHEDHIGAMPYILKDVNAPVYGSTLTLGLLRGKLNEQQVKADLRPVEARQQLEIGPFKVEFIQLTHSIPDSMGLAIHTPIGTILLISDFKMDMTPIDGKQMDYGRISALGEKGVLLLMSDSTNVEKEGFSQSERTVGGNLIRYFAAAPGRIIVTSFASHVHRAQQVLWAADRTDRKVAVVGRGMQNMFAVATGLGYLHYRPDQVIDIERINDYPANRVVVLTTGSQGEPLSGLTRMSSGEHRQVQIMAGDTVIISATPIPGNERTVGKTVDNLFRLGANVIHERSQGIHVSGHACKEELKMLLNMVHPRFFLPIHGEYRMLYKHAQLAQSLGMAESDTVVMENGQILELTRHQCRVNGTVPSGKVYIDGLGVGDIGAAVLKERRQLSEGGVIAVSLVFRGHPEPKILVGPEIYTRGFIFEKDYEHIIGEMKERVVALCTPENLADGSLNELRNQVRTRLARFVAERTGRRPVIMALINQV